jgi:RimJ/RimL family protein N-acetyltransferase
MRPSHQTSYKHDEHFDAPPPSPSTRPALGLRDGRRLAVRPIRSSDRQGIADLFSRLSPRSRHRRFLTPKPTLSRRELDFFTNVDHVTHEAIVAVDRRDGAIVGVARYVRDGRSGVAEVAVEVADDMHNRGIGSALLARTIARAGENGFTRLTAMTLWDNGPARALMRRFEFRPVTAHGTTISLALELD